jgi:hypothetical protein
MTTDSKKRSIIIIYLSPIFWSFSFLVTLNGQNSHGKEFDTLIAKAHSLEIKEEFEAAGKIYDQALALKKGRFPDTGYYNGGFIVWNNAKNMDRAIFYLQKIAEEGWLPDESLDRLRTHVQYQEVRRDSRFQRVLQIHLDKRHLYGGVADSLLETYRKDQALRQILSCAQEKFVKDSSSLEYFYGLMDFQDSVNLNYVEKTIEKYGWLGQNKIGDKANRTLWLIIQHAPLEKQEKYLPILRESVKAGETRASNYAFLQDRVRMRKGKKQVYGTQVIKNHETGESKVYPIENPESVDARRAEIGFEPIQEYLTFFNIKIKTVNDLDDPKVMEYYISQQVKRQQNK